MKKLYRFSFDCGRMGSLDGTFVAEEEEINKAIGQELYFGEVLGKHSEIYGELDKNDIEVLTDDQDFIQKFESFKCGSGFNPLDYLPEEDDEEDDEGDEDDEEFD